MTVSHAKSMDFKEPTEEFQYPNLVETADFFTSKAMRGFKTLRGIVPPFLNEAASIAASTKNAVGK